MLHLTAGGELRFLFLLTSIADPGRPNELAQTMRDASICGLGQAAPNAFITAMQFFTDEPARTEVAGQPDRN